MLYCVSCIAAFIYHIISYILLKHFTCEKLIFYTYLSKETIYYNTVRLISKRNTRMIDMNNIMLVMTVWKCKTKWTH